MGPFSARGRGEKVRVCTSDGYKGLSCEGDLCDEGRSWGDWCDKLVRKASSRKSEDEFWFRKQHEIMESKWPPRMWTAMQRWRRSWAPQAAGFKANTVGRPMQGRRSFISIDAPVKSILKHHRQGHLRPWSFSRKLPDIPARPVAPEISWHIHGDRCDNLAQPTNPDFLHEMGGIAGNQRVNEHSLPMQ